MKLPIAEGELMVQNRQAVGVPMPEKNPNLAAFGEWDWETTAINLFKPKGFIVFGLNLA